MSAPQVTPPTRLEAITAQLQAMDWLREMLRQEEWRLIAERNAILRDEERQRQRQLREARKHLGESVREVA